MAVNQFPPEGSVTISIGNHQREGFEIGQFAGDLLPGIGSLRMDDGRPFSGNGVAPGRKLQDAKPLELLQYPEGGILAVLTLGIVPVQVFADGLGQFVAAVARKQGDGFLYVADLPASETAAEKGC